MNRPLISVVIPVFNKEEWVTKTLLSVFNQTYQNWECLIVNDGSTDASLEIIEIFIRDHPGNWKMINQKNQGQTRARNAGIEKATGDYIAFLDADDLWLPSKLEMQLSTHLSDPEIGLTLTAYAIFKEGQVDNFRVVTYRDANKMIKNWFSLTGFGGLIESTGFLARKTLEGAGGYSEIFSMTSGLELSLKIASRLKVVVLPEPLVLYRLSDGQFHKHEDILIKDLGVMVEKCAKDAKDSERLQRSHLSYLYWSNCRGQGLKNFGIASLKALLSLDTEHLPMLFFLLSRNVIALIRGRRKRSVIRNYLMVFAVK